MKIVNEIGNRYGRLLVIARAHSNKYGQARWLCRCDCGKEIIVNGYALRQNNTASCGCLRADTTAQKNIDNTIHGAKSNFTETREYRAYMAAKGRCVNVRNTSYADYGGRGIRFCFDNFSDFLAEVGVRPSALHSLDRIDNDGHYIVGNLRWSTKGEQANNRRSYHETLTRKIALLEAENFKLKQQIKMLGNLQLV